MNIPSDKKGGLLLELKKKNNPILTDDFLLLDENNNSLTFEKGIHYVGKVKGVNNSLVSISFFSNSLMGTINYDSQVYDIGKIKTSNGREKEEIYTLYNSTETALREFFCSTSDKIEESLHSHDLQNKPKGRSNTTPTVKIYFECDLSLYEALNDDYNSVENFVEGAFNVVRELYSQSNINVNLQISGIKIWGTTSPYNLETSSTALNSFRDLLDNKFNGNLAHLLTLGTDFGGRARLKALCVGDGYAVSNIKNFYFDFPIYSQSIFFIAHELGHNLGSQHTHACVWNGNDTQIDDCGNTKESSDGVKNGCFDLNNDSPIIPSNGGTIMSYCHNNSTGINFTKGFHPQVRNTINNYLQSNLDCLTDCIDNTRINAGTDILGGDVNNPNLITLVVKSPINFTVDNFYIHSGLRKINIPKSYISTPLSIGAGQYEFVVNLLNLQSIIAANFNNCNTYDLGFDMTIGNTVQKIEGKQQLVFINANCQDIGGLKYYTTYVKLGAILGLYTGEFQSLNETIGRINTTDNIRKKEVAKIIYLIGKARNLFGEINIDPNSVPYYSDLEKCDEYFPYIQGLYNLGLSFDFNNNYKQFQPNHAISYAELCTWLVYAFSIKPNCGLMNKCEVPRQLDCSNIASTDKSNVEIIEDAYINYNGNIESIGAWSYYQPQSGTVPIPDCGDLINKGDAARLLINTWIYLQQNSNNLKNNNEQELTTNNAISRNSSLDVSKWNVIGQKPRLFDYTPQQTIQAPAKKYYYLKDNQPWTSGEGGLVDGSGNEVVYYWSIDGGNLESLKPKHNQIRWTPPKVNETTTFELHIWIANEVGDFAEGIFYFVVEPSGSNSNLSVSTNNVNHPKERSDEYFNVFSNTDWRITETSSWFTVFPAIGSGNEQIKVTAIQHNSATPRTGTMTVTGGGVTETITVTQAGVNAILNINKESLTYGASSELQKVSIVSNVNWNIEENVSWLSISDVIMNGTRVVDFIVEPNENNTSRGTIVTISGGGISRNIEVFQGGKIGEDIFLSNPSLSKTVVQAGSSTRAVVTQNYRGISETILYPHFYMYLSDDPFFDNSDIFLGEDDSSLNVNDMDDEHGRTVDIPNNTQSGSYYIVFVGDAEEEIVEENENNNVIAVEIRVGSLLSCAILSSPNNNATNVNVSTNLQWGEVVNAVGYKLSIGTTSGGIDILNNLDVGYVTSYDLPNDLPYDSNIYVSLTAYDNVSDAIGCNEYQFTTETNVNCTTPPIPVIMNGLSANLINNAGASEITVQASDFNIASYSECSSIVAYSFSEDVNDIYRTFDCNTIGFQSVQIWVTDEQGNQSTAFTYISVQDFFGLCSGGSVSDCDNSLVVYNGLATALDNNNHSLMAVEKMVKRLEENCTGEGVLNFEYRNFEDTQISLDNNSLGTQTVAVQLKINGQLSSKINSFILVQPQFSNSACIPVPIVFNGLATSLDSNGLFSISATAFDAGSYSNCGGNISLSFSSDANDTQRTFDCSNLGTNSLDIWITDSQTGSQNKVSTYILIQDITNSCATDCPTNYIFSASEVVESGIYKAAAAIEFQNTVDFSESLILQAGNSISLLPGTHIQKNSNFLAKIEDCETSSLNEPIDYSYTKVSQIALPTPSEELDILVFPNPFQSQTTIQYYLPTAGNVQLQIRDFLGRNIKVLVDKKQERAGLQEIQLNSENLPTGTYFVLLNHNGQITSTKVILTK